MRKINYMNSKGQAALVGLMIGVALFVLSIVFIAPLKDLILGARAVDQLDCDNSSISDSQKGTCLIVDLIMPYFIMVCLAVAGGYIGAKFILGG